MQFGKIKNKKKSMSLFSNNLLKTKRNLAPGFTLIETLVAITILISAVAGPMVLVQKSLSSANLSKDQVTSFYLAGEAIEYIRNKRDENTLSGVSWTNGISQCIDKKCAVDAVNDTITQCSNDCPNLQFDQINGFYGYNSEWSESEFNRFIEIKNINEDELSISVTISWKSGSFMRSFSIKENLFSWQ